MRVATLSVARAVTTNVGCYSFRSVKPEELPKLNDGTRARLQLKNGSPETFRPGPRVRLTGVEPKIFVEAPYEFATDERLLYVAEEGEAPRHIPLTVVRAQVRDFDEFKTGILTAVISLSALLVINAAFHDGCAVCWDSTIH